jgi:hypothetical protein
MPDPDPANLVNVLWVMLGLMLTFYFSGELYNAIFHGNF